MTGSSIELAIETNNTGINHVIVDSEKISFQSQGLIEGGHKNWNESAKLAIEIALEEINSPHKLTVTIKKLEGRIFLDTNNASIGISCILALWEYFKFTPEDIIMERIHKFVQEDWNNDVKSIPNFKRIYEN